MTARVDPTHMAAMAAEGKTPEEIAAAVGISAEVVRTMLAMRARRAEEALAAAEAAKAERVARPKTPKPPKPPKPKAPPPPKPPNHHRDATRHLKAALAAVQGGQFAEAEAQTAAALVALDLLAAQFRPPSP